MTWVRPRWESREPVTSGAVGTRGARSRWQSLARDRYRRTCERHAGGVAHDSTEDARLARLRHNLRRLQQCYEEQCRAEFFASAMSSLLVGGVCHQWLAFRACQLLPAKAGSYFARWLWHGGTLAPWHPGTLAPRHPWHFRTPGTLAPLALWHLGTLGTLALCRRERYHYRNAREETFCTKTENISSRQRFRQEDGATQESSQHLSQAIGRLHSESRITENRDCEGHVTESRRQGASKGDTAEPTLPAANASVAKAEAPKTSAPRKAAMPRTKRGKVTTDARKKAPPRWTS